MVKLVDIPAGLAGVYITRLHNGAEWLVNFQVRRGGDTSLQSMPLAIGLLSSLDGDPPLLVQMILEASYQIRDLPDVIFEQYIEAHGAEIDSLKLRVDALEA